MLVPFDQEKLEIIGNPFPVLENVMQALTTEDSVSNTATEQGSARMGWALDSPIPSRAARIRRRIRRSTVFGVLENRMSQLQPSSAAETY
jgi:hypothetical protein